MKKVISIVLIFSMLIFGTATVLAADSEGESKNYDIKEIFENYNEYSLSEMVEFINDEPQAYSFILALKEDLYGGEYNELYTAIHMSGEYGGSSAVINSFHENRFTYEIRDYFNWDGSRPTTPSDEPNVGKKGNKTVSVKFDEKFVEYICSLDTVKSNKLIVDLFMNLMDEELVGVEWSVSYIYGNGGNTSDGAAVEFPVMGDCNGDGAINGVDGYLMKEAILGNNDDLDPFAIDLNADGAFDAKDSYALKQKIVRG